MKIVKISMLASAVAVLLMTSCLGDEKDFNAGFVIANPNSPVTAHYANNTIDTLAFVSHGPWTITAGLESQWCVIPTVSGLGNTFYSIPVTMQQNTTGKSRVAMFTLRDSNHPSDGHATFYYTQYATRGDGSFGLAADVKSVAGSDGSTISVTYDQLHRPLTLRMTNAAGTMIHDLKLQYNDVDSLLTITDGVSILKGRCINGDYQPLRLVGDGDTIGYFSQYDARTATPISANQAFSIEHRLHGGRHVIYSYLIGGQSLSPDSIHNADSLRVYDSSNNDGVLALKLISSTADNRYQSLDVNQLVSGIDHCDPYQLLSLFRYSRNTNILQEVTSTTTGSIIEVQLNADRSVHSMTVKHTSGGVVLSDIPVTYTFSY